MLSRNRIFTRLMVVAAMALFTLPSNAQTKSKTKTARTPASTKDATPASSNKVTQKTGDQLDISDLENQYWAPKDQDFDVVQNRTYSKAKRVAVSLGYGTLLNDSYRRSNNLSVSGNYYFSERYGVEVNFTSTEPNDTKMVTTFEDRYGATPNHGKVTGYYGASFNWVPFYAKMSLLGQRILYFDMAFSPGLGLTTYDQQTDSGAKAASSPTLSFDVSQSIFFSKNLAFRVDFKNRWFQEEVLEWRKPPSTTSTGSDNPVLRDETTSNSFLMFGVTYFF